MKRPLWDHTFRTIGDRNATSSLMVERKIEHCKEVRQAIADAYGEDEAASLFSSEIIYALRQCGYALSPATNVDAQQYEINFTYAVSAAKAIDEVIDKSFSHLDL